MVTAESLHLRTPLVISPTLSQELGRDVFLKLENLQPSGSFKMRGIGFMCSRAKARGCTTLVSSSGGNAGAAVAVAGQRLGMKAVVIVPQTTPEFMRQRLVTLGAEVVVHGSVWDEADLLAKEKASSPSTAYIPPFDHADIWTGHASMITELQEDLQARLGAEETAVPAAVIVAVGGGGLLCGVCEGMEEVGWQTVPVIAAETEGAASFAAALNAGTLVTIPGINSISKSLGATRVAAKCLDYVNRRPIFSQTVTDQEAMEACYHFAVEHRMLVEPACGTAVAVVRSKAKALQKHLSGPGPVVVVICGGNMMSPALLASLMSSTGANGVDVVASS